MFLDLRRNPNIHILSTTLSKGVLGFMFLCPNFFVFFVDYAFYYVSGVTSIHNIGCQSNPKRTNQCFELPKIFLRRSSSVTQLDK